MALHAAAKHPDPPAPRATRRRELGQGRRARDLGQQGFRPGRGRKRVQQAAASDQGAKARALVHAQRAEHPAQAIRVRKEAEDQALAPSRPPARGVAAKLGARRLDQRSEGHARRTGRLARAAAKAQIHVADEGLAGLDAALGGGPHQIDAPAGRVHLLAEDAVGRTLGQADSTVDALAQLVEARSRFPPLIAGEHRRPRHRPPTKRPGFRTPSGSNSRLRARMRSIAPGATGPHGSTAARTAAGARSTTALPSTGATTSRTRATSAAASRGLAPSTGARRRPSGAQPRRATAAEGDVRATAASMPRAVAATWLASVDTRSAMASARGGSASACPRQRSFPAERHAPPASRAISPIRTSWSRTAASTLPTEIATEAAAPVTPQGRPASAFSHSTRFGWAGESTRAATKLWAASALGNSAMDVPADAGAGCSRRVSSATMPSVPRAPTMSLGTS